MQSFYPQRIESALPAGGLMDSLIAARRPAAAWNLYKQQYASARAEAADPFKGASFRGAYEQEAERRAAPHG